MACVIKQKTSFMDISDAFAMKVRMTLELNTPAVIAARMANTGHLLGLCALLGQSVVNMYKSPLFSKSPLKCDF